MVQGNQKGLPWGVEKTDVASTSTGGSQTEWAGTDARVMNSGIGIRDSSNVERSGSAATEANGAWQTSGGLGLSKRRSYADVVRSQHEKERKLTFS